jgi:hypothetical protein
MYVGGGVGEVLLGLPIGLPLASPLKMEQVSVPFLLDG